MQQACSCHLLKHTHTHAHGHKGRPDRHLSLESLPSAALQLTAVGVKVYMCKVATKGKAESGGMVPLSLNELTPEASSSCLDFTH